MRACAYLNLAWTVDAKVGGVLISAGAAIVALPRIALGAASDATVLLHVAEILKLELPPDMTINEMMQALRAMNTQEWAEETCQTRGFETPNESNTLPVPERHWGVLQRMMRSDRPVRPPR